MRAIKRTLFIAALALLAPAALLADKKDDLYKQATAAATGSKVDEAARLYCELAKMDAGYKDAKMMCTIMTNEAEKERKRNEDRFQAGMAAFQKGDWEDAVQKFRNVKSGPRLAEAQQYLSNRIPQAQAAAKAKSDQEAASKADSEVNARFEQAVQAYNRNDFNSARGGFGQFGGTKRAGDAQSYLNKIREYEQAMNEANTLASAKNFDRAIGAYREAMAVKGDGPGDPSGRIRDMESQKSGAAAPPPAPTPTPSTTVAVSTPVAPPPKPVTAAIKVMETPKVDVGKLLAEAETAQKRGQVSTAKGKYLAVLAADKNNAQALAALDQLNAQAAPSKEKASSEADVLLAKGIGEFYQGLYDDAEFDIKYYLRVNGSKTALSNFYLGVVKLTQYYLRGEQVGDRKLLADAQNSFKAAKRTAGFRPPEKFVSPKILKVYSDVTQ